MISLEKIKSLIAEKLEEGNYFVVSLDVSTTNKIKLVVDSFEGITIQECVAFSRQIEHNLDREEEDFELEVASPGLSSPLTVIQQYQKNIGRDLNVLLSDNTRITGQLLEVNEDVITLLEKKKVKVEGKKKKQTVEEKIIIKFTDIQSALIVIKF